MNLYFGKEEHSMYKLLFLSVVTLGLFACGEKTEDTAGATDDPSELVTKSIDFDLPELSSTPNKFSGTPHKWFGWVCFLIFLTTV